MRSLNHTLLAAAALALTATTASAQSTALEIEGKIFALDPDPSGNGGAVVRVMGVDITIPPGTPIASPTASLTIDQLISSQPLPGRVEPGFLGGTAIITGTTGADGAVATDVFVEPAENVLLGRMTGPLQVEGMAVELLGDPRLPSLPVMNAFGFEVDPASIAVGTPSAVEGYYVDAGVDSRFYAFLLETEGGTAVNAGVQEVSVQRAQCRQRTNGTIELEVRGSTHDPAAGRVTFRNVAGTRTYGSVTAAADAADPQFGSYVFRVQSSGLGPCPSEIVAVFGTARTVGTVAVRID